jgi:hypothetical protein
MSSESGDLIMVVHGPEAFDAGDVAWLIERCRPGQVLVAGVMARTAAEESGLPVICTDERPSVVMRGLPGRAFLVNRGKTHKTGRIFGEIVAGRMSAGRGLVQVECSSRTIYRWNDADGGLARELSLLTGYPVADTESRPAKPGDIREIRGCIPGEAVFVNGIVIGIATAETVVLSHGTGTLEVQAGLHLKPHGVEKLLRTGMTDIRTAWCKSGMVRTALPLPGRRRCGPGRVRVVDHCGHTLYQKTGEDVCGILAIGDDTTAICGHICAHDGIPVFGVVDGDADDIIRAGYAPDSVVVEVTEGRDDEVGRDLATAMDLHSSCWEDWVEEALRYLEGRVRIVVDLRGEQDAMC